MKANEDEILIPIIMHTFCKMYAVYINTDTLIKKTNMFLRMHIG